MNPNQEYNGALLVADDERDVRELVEFIGAQSGFDKESIIGASTGNEAYEKFLELQTPSAVIALDMRMPNGNGRDFIQKLIDNEHFTPEALGQKNIQIMLMSATPDYMLQIQEEFVDTGIIPEGVILGKVSKPFNTGEVLVHLEKRKTKEMASVA